MVSYRFRAICPSSWLRHRRTPDVFRIIGRPVYLHAVLKQKLNWKIKSLQKLCSTKSSPDRQTKAVKLAVVIRRTATNGTETRKTGMILAISAFTSLEAHQVMCYIQAIPHKKYTEAHSLRCIHTLCKRSIQFQIQSYTHK